MLPNLRIVSGDSALPPISGGGNDGGMEQRVATLEKDVSGIMAALGRIELAITKVDAALPSLAT